MTEDQRIYHELEMLQEMDMLEKRTNICEITANEIADKDTTDYNEISVELENHMVIGINDEEI